MTTALLLTAALAIQQPDLGDAESVSRLLASLRAADPAVCELAGRSLTNFGGWWNGDLPTPMPVPMPTPMPMPHSGGGIDIRTPSLRCARHRGPGSAGTAGVSRRAEGLEPLRPPHRCPDGGAGEAGVGRGGFRRAGEGRRCRFARDRPARTRRARGSGDDERDDRGAGRSRTGGPDDGGLGPGRDSNCRRRFRRWPGRE